MQMSQLGQIEVLEEKVHALDGHVQDLKHKLAEQDHIIANLVGDNLNHLQNKMSLRVDITSTVGIGVQSKSEYAQNMS